MAPKELVGDIGVVMIDTPFIHPTTAGAGEALIRPLRVAVDFPWDASACMGTGAYSETMVRALAQCAPQFQITLLVAPGAPRNLSLPNVAYRELRSVNVLREGIRQIAIPGALLEMEADCLFAPATLLPLVKVCPMITTVHDLSFVRSPEFYAPGLLEQLNRWFDPSLEMADLITAISEETRRDLLELKGVPGAKISVIRQPVRNTFGRSLQAEDVAAKLRALGVVSPYFFHVSNLSVHKNVSFAIRAFDRFIRKHPESRHSFIFAGGGYAPNQPPDLHGLSESLGVADRVKYTGKVDDDTLKALYQGSDALLFPSLSEGWGLPVAEATALGVRVLASHNVPAASLSQRFKLDLDEWVSAMETPSSGRAPTGSATSDLAGKALADAITRVVEGKKIAGTRNAGRGIDKQGIGISGCTIVRNGVRLGYPLEASIESYAPLCDEIILCWDPTSEDATGDLVRGIARRFTQITLVESAWDLHNREGGMEIARQTQIAFSHCTRPWTLYVQADEAVHEAGYGEIVMVTQRGDLVGASVERRSFLGTLDREIPEMRSDAIVRLFRSRHGRSVGDAMHVAVDGGNGSILKTGVTFFNYSRLGTDEEVRARSNNLNRFYHDDAFIARLDPDRNKRWRTIQFSGSHPSAIERLYRTRPSVHRKEKSPVSVVISVDDIRPEPGCGLELESGPVGMLRNLHSEFGCKFTLFMPTNYYGRADLRDHREWFRTLIATGIFEVACHGHHHWNLVEGRGDMEYSTESLEEIRGSIARSLEVFQALGYCPEGAKPPGWGYNPRALPVFAEHFEYVADHLIGTEWQSSQIQGLPLMPYSRCIHEPMDDLLDAPGSLIVLHSHLSGEGGKHQNGWDSVNERNVRRFLGELRNTRGVAVSFVTAAEALRSWKEAGRPLEQPSGVETCA